MKEDLNIKVEVLLERVDNLITTVENVNHKLDEHINKEDVRAKNCAGKWVEDFVKGFIVTVIAGLFITGVTLSLQSFTVNDNINNTEIKATKHEESHK